MTVGVIDVGSNTVRLLVARAGAGSAEAVRDERAHLGLGACVERDGRVPDEKIAEAAAVARRFARLAREYGADAVDVFVTAPGRGSANAAELLSALARATGWPVRVLSTEDEGQLAFAGAVARTPGLPPTVAVCDVGGGSTEILVGSSSGLPVWCRSYALGSIQLAERFAIDDPPGKRAVAALRAEARRQLHGMGAPERGAALATGGSARALRRLVGRTLGEDELAEAVKILRRRSSAQISKTFRIDSLRARTMIAGAVVLAEAQRHLGLPFVVARGGLREGAAIGLLAELAAA